MSTDVITELLEAAQQRLASLEQQKLEQIRILGQIEGAIAQQKDHVRQLEEATGKSQVAAKAKQ